MYKYSGEEFLSKLYRDMHTYNQVKKSSDPNDSKYEKIRKYLERLESIHRKLSEKERLELIKKFYYKKYVIKPENITNEYFNHLEKIALNRGYGHIKYSEYQKTKEKEIIINDQKKSLDIWIDYFCSEDSNMYPIWFKYYVFQSVVKLGSFNKEKNIYNQRTEDTISIFPELNREALAQIYDYFVAQIKGEEDFDDKELEKLIDGKSFKKIYAYLIKKLSLVKKQKTNINDGEWIKYERGSDHLLLVKSLEGKGTGWCTSGEATAKTQLSRGDFYIFYSYDNEGMPTIPRIAIRMEKNNIAEIRGIAKDQNIEQEMEKVLEKKLEEFPDKDRYKKKVKDMEFLTKIYNKHLKNEELEKEELKFIYEIEDFIEGFGYKKDPRIEEIIIKRNKRTDLAKIFGCKEQLIALTEAESALKDIVYCDTYLDLSHITSSVILSFPKIIKRTLYLQGITEADILELPEIIEGDICLNNLKKVNLLKISKSRQGNIYLGNLETAEVLELPETMNGDIDLDELKDIKKIKLPKTIDGYIYLRSLETIEELELPETMKGNIDLGTLKNIKKIKLPKTIHGDICLRSLETIEELELPETMNGNIDLGKLKNIKKLKLPKTIHGDICLRSLETIEELELPETMNGNIDLGTLKNIKKIKLPKTIHGNIYLRSLETIEELELPETMNGNLFLDKLKSAKGLKFPKKIAGDLILSNLETADGLELPECIEGSLNLNGLTSVKFLKIPQNFRCKKIYMCNLIEEEKKKIPKIDWCNIFTNSDDIFDEEVVLGINRH